MKTPLIVFYDVSTHLGGAERSLIELIQGLQDSETFESRVLVPKNTGPLLDELRKLSVPFDHVPFPGELLDASRSRPLNSLKVMIQSTPGFRHFKEELLNHLTQVQPSLIHTTGVKCHIFGALAGARLGIPVVWHLRDIFKPGATRTLLRLIADVTRPFIVANSDATARAFRTRDTRVIYNGIDPTVYIPKKNQHYHELFGLPKTARVVGIIGVLARWKGQKEFISMAKQLCDEGQDLHFVIVGGEIYDTSSDKWYGTELKDRVKSLGLEARVHFAGFEKEPAHAINGFDVLVHASVEPEPFGRVLIEGMACGVPVIGTNLGGVPEIIRHRHNGLLCRAADVGQMAKAVKEVLENDVLREKLIKDGRQTFLEKFTRDRHAKEMKIFIEEVIKVQNSRQPKRFRLLR